MIERLLSVRRNVEALRDALLTRSPEDLERRLPALGEAVVCLRQVEAELRDCVARDGASQLEELALEASKLKEALAVTRQVAAGSAEFYEGWLQVLAAEAGGYTRAGQAAPLAPAATVSIQG